MYDNVVALYAAEADATANHDRDAMTQVLSDASQIRLNSPQIQNCKIVRDLIDRIHVEEKAASITLSEEHMRVTLEAADRLQMKTEICENFRRLLGVSKEQLIKEQLKQVFFFYHSTQGTRCCKKKKT